MSVEMRDLVWASAFTQLVVDVGKAHGNVFTRRLSTTQRGCDGRCIQH